MAIAVVVLLSAGISAFAQQKISGTIKDAQGPVIGASVVVNGTSNGTITDVNGAFTLNVPETLPSW